MYVPVIIFCLVFLGVAFAFYNLNERHRHELKDLTEKYENEKIKIIEGYKDTYNYYQQEIEELKKENAIIKDGTLVDELKYRVDDLEDENESLKQKHKDEIVNLATIQEEEMTERLNRCYAGLLVVENILRRLNATYDLQQIIAYYKTLTSDSGENLIEENEYLIEEIDNLLQWEESDKDKINNK